MSGLQTTGNTAGPAAPGVSVIICARNEARNLQLYLPIILKQQYAGAWELLVVDDASADDTSEVLRSFQPFNPHLRCLSITNKTLPGKKQALTAGIRAAKYDHILLTDADCSPASIHWLQQMTAPFTADSRMEIVLGYGPVRPSHKGGLLERWTRYETAFVAIQYVTCARMGIPYMGVGRNLAFKKAVFERAGGFAAHAHIASGDDDLLVNAVATCDNTACCLHPASFVFSAGKSTWPGWFRQKKRHLSAGIAYKRQHQALLTLFSLSHILHYSLLPLLLLGCNTLELVLYLCVLRNLFFFCLYRKAFLTLGESGLLPHFPIYDAMLAVYFGVIIPISLIGKQTPTWN